MLDILVIDSPLSDDALFDIIEHIITHYIKIFKTHIMPYKLQ
jgi:hypothetical protein